MLQVQEKREVLTGGFSDVRKFTIQNSAKMFRITVSGLYADKVKAVLREYLANAYDAQLQAGNADKPFDLHLPTQWEPWFSVRDYGCSLTHEGVMNNFASIGWSSKDGSSNEVSKDLAARQVGKFGLGCKVGFAYSDTFSVVAILNGERRTYNAYMDEDGAPVIAHAFTEATDEPNGVEITVPVNVNDIDNFKRAATEVLRGFDVQPNLTGARVATNTDEVILSGDNWKLFRSESNWRTSFTAQARQGTVIYPIDVNALPGLSKFQQTLLQEQIVIDFPVGEVDITPSRESLSYDPTTIQNIKNRLALIEAEMRSRIDQKIAEQPNLWTARLALDKLQSSLNLRYNLRDALLKGVTYKGAALENYTTINTPVMYHYTPPAVGKLLTRKAFKFTHAALQRFRQTLCTDTVTIIISNAIELKRPFARVAEFIKRRHANTGRVPGLLLIEVPSYRSKEYVQVVRALGGAPFVKLESLPLPPAAVRAPGAPKRARNAAFSARYLTEDRGNTGRSGLNDLVDPAGSGYYLHIEDRDPRDHNGKSLSFSRIQSLLRALSDANQLPRGTQVFLIPANKKGVITKAKGWQNLSEYAFKVAEAATDFSALTASEKLVSISGSNAHLFASKFTGTYADDHIVSRLRAVSNQKPDQAAVKAAQARESLRVFFELPVAKAADGEELVDEFNKAYPLLAHIDRYSLRGSDEALKSAEEYVSFVDASKAA